MRRQPGERQFVRGILVLIQLLWAEYLLPCVGIQLSPSAIGGLVLGRNEGSYFLGGSA